MTEKTKGIRKFALRLFCIFRNGWKPAHEFALIITAIGTLFIAWNAYELSLSEAEARRKSDLVAFEREREARTIERLRIRPYISIDFNLSNDQFLVYLRNQGLGPGRIKWFRVFLDGEGVTDWDEVYTRLNLKIDNSTRNFSMVYPDSILPIDRASGPKRLLRERAVQSSHVLWLQRQRLRIAICFCSLLDECQIKVTGGIEIAENKIKPQLESCSSTHSYRRFFSIPKSYY